MPVICSKCTQTIGKKSPGVRCFQCDLAFHGRCVGLSSQALAALSADGSCWKCSGCRVSSPGRSSVLINDNDDDSGVAPGNELLRSINDQLKSLNAKYNDILASITFCSDKISDFEKSLSVLENKCKAIDDIKLENQQLKDTVTDLQRRVDEQAQYSRLNNIEIQGVPFKEGENVYKILEAIGMVLHCPMDELQIDTAHRVQSRNPSNRDGSIVARFFSRRVKDNIIASASRLRRERRLNVGEGHSGTGIKVDGISDNIYINEHLSLKNKLLLKSAREACKISNYKYVWAKNGTVFVRKSDGSKIITIRSEDDVTKIR